MTNQKIKISETIYGEIQKIKHDNNMTNEEDVINMLIQYYNDPLFHLSEDYKLELIRMMDKQKEENRVENIEQMIKRMIEQLEDYQLE